MIGLLLSLALQSSVLMRVAVTVPVDPPSALQASSVAIGGKGKRAAVVLSWKASPDQNCKGWSGYDVYRSTGTNGAFAKILASPTRLLTYRDATVLKGQAYRYQVMAVVGKISSKPSNVVKVTP